MAHRALVQKYKRHHVVLSCSIVVAAIVFAVANHKAGRLQEVPPSTLSPMITDTEPVQAETTMPSFNFEYENVKYVVHPRAEYELYGLLVTHNNTTGIGDIYHDDRSVDLKDICVVWGRNAASGVYQKIQFWSEPWTCRFGTRDDEVWNDFSLTEVSNNHLLAGTEKVRAVVKGLHVGDQVYLKGYLVDYAHQDYPEQLRQSSLTRTDTGDGACEVFFVSDARVIKAAPGPWFFLRKIFGWLSLSLLAFKAGYLFFTSQREFQALRE